MRYYVHRSSWFDSHPYRISQIVKAVKQGGGFNVRTSLAYGWSNQPPVVTFSAAPATLSRVEGAVQAALGQRAIVIIRKKDW